jgi:hypothetical protein
MIVLDAVIGASRPKRAMVRLDIDQDLHPRWARTILWRFKAELGPFRHPNCTISRMDS